jgi:lipoprotein-anchoring transpeptidase ErfK/SrfK
MNPTQHHIVRFRSPFAAIVTVATLALFGAPTRTIAAQTAALQSLGDSGAVLASAGDPGIHIEASISQRRLFIKRGDEVLREYPVAVGQEGYPTPRGRFMIRRIVWNPRWTPPPNSEWARKLSAKEPGHPENPMKLVKIFFKEPDYYIHGTDQLSSLGSAASHGCLRMDPFDAADVAKYVMENGGQPREESWFWKILHVGREEKEVYLKNPVPITISE